MNSDIDVSQFIDNMLAKFDEEIKVERRLINEVIYPITRSCSISTGLSPARGFLPAVNIAHKTNNISFTSSDWEQFLKYSEHIEEHITGRCSCEEAYNVAEIAILKWVFIGKVPAMQIQCRGVTLSIRKQYVKLLLQMSPLVSQRVRRLEELNFRCYYNHLLQLLAENKETFSPNFEDYVISLISSGQEFNWNSEYRDCMLEIIMFHITSLKNDLYLL